MPGHAVQLYLAATAGLVFVSHTATVPLAPAAPSRNGESALKPAENMAPTCERMRMSINSQHGDIMAGRTAKQHGTAHGTRNAPAALVRPRVLEVEGSEPGAFQIVAS